MSVHDDEWLVCDICSFKTLGEEEYKSHLDTHLPIDGYHCTMCEFISPAADDFNDHLLKNHSVPMNSRTSLVGIDYWETHEVSNDDEEASLDVTVKSELLNCKKCEFSSACLKALQAHLITHIDTAYEDVRLNRPKIVYRTVHDGAILPPLSQIIY